MKAMLNLSANKRFRELGWGMVLQVHDEIIAEGPEESVDEAMEIVRLEPLILFSSTFSSTFFNYSFLLCVEGTAWSTPLLVHYCLN